ASVPEHVQEIIKRNLRNKKQQYSSELRQFALTLQYYSPRAYNYIRHKWRDLLPHSSTIKNWYSNINCKPGFQKQALDAIANENKKKKVLLNIVIDEMAIRSQIIYGSNRFYGGVDLGSHMSFESDNDNLPKATHALVFMAVAINGSFKVPIAYFLIKSLTGEERANLLSKCLELINDTGAKAVSIVFDGAPTNLSMCSHLGANFTYPSVDFKPWIIDPFTKEKIFIFWDACHMLKLVRNTLGDHKILKDKHGSVISWEYISLLHTYQQEQGLHCATKLTNKHINFQDNRMNVKLAAQTLSETDHNKQLIELKNRGPYIFPSNDVKKICQFTEKIIRQHLHHIFLSKTPQLIKSEAFAVVGTNAFDSDVLIDHIKSQDILDNHRVQLIKAVINIYVEIRLHYEAKISNEKSEYLRHKYTKLIHFYHS
ncbi:hypothetical protein ILUMI_18161, partial [Ignelater luminosus]